MPGRFDDRLADYVDVKERVRLFYERFPDGRLVTHRVRLTSKPDGVPRVIVQAQAFRSAEDPMPGWGSSWMVLPGSTPYTRGSELENVETSAWGRAIGALGIGIDKSVASRDEIDAKAVPPTDHVAATDGSLIGIAEVGKVGSGADFALRQSPEGPVCAFRLTQGRKGWKVIAHGSMATALAAFRPEGERVTVWGSMQDETFSKGGKDITFQVINLERIKGDDFELPSMAEHDEALREAESLPAFAPDELADVTA